MPIVTLEGSALAPVPARELDTPRETTLDQTGPVSRWDAVPFDDVDDPNAFAFPRQVDPVQPIEFICQGCFLVLSCAVRSPGAAAGSRGGFCVDCA